MRWVHNIWVYISLINPNFITVLPGGSDGKEFAYNAGDLGSIPGWGKSPGEGNGNPLQCSCLENPHGERSLEGYSPWGYKELDMIEKLTHTQLYYHRLMLSIS